MSDSIYNDGTYAQRNPTWHAEHGGWKVAHLFSLLDEGVIAGAVRRDQNLVVEVGCGYGGVLAGFCARLRECGVRCSGIGYDISRAAILEAHKRHPDLEFRHGDSSADPRCFDLGLFVDLVEHLDDPLSFLRDNRARFRLLLLHIPLDENLYNRWQYGSQFQQRLVDNCGHIHSYTKASAIRMLRRAGMRIVRWKYTLWGLELYRELATRRSAPLVRLLRSAGNHLWPDASVRIMGGASLAVLCVPQPAIQGRDHCEVTKKGREP
jgi:SAM-dependent methyltransferase